jgi:Ca-activated chloride channel homolog
MNTEFGMQFDQKIWLVVLGIAIVLSIWLFRSFNTARLNALKSFASHHLLDQLMQNVSVRRRTLKRWLLVIGLSLGLIALARPQIGFRWEESKRKGIDILFAVDTSRSMLAQDVNPDRLGRAKMAVLDLVAKLPGDRIGLIAFAGSSFLQSPLTLDYDAFRQSLDALDTTIIPKGGTNLASAIQEAEKAFSVGAQTHKILILITDGEDLEANGIEAAKRAAKEGMKIFTVGVGSSSGEIIPITNEAGGTDFLKDEKGNVVKSRLDEASLQEIAQVTGGIYEPLGQQNQGLETIYDHGLASLPKQELSSRRNRVFIERFQWPLAFGIVFLIIEFLMSDRRSSSSWKFKLPFNWKRSRSIVSLWILVLLPLTGWSSPQSAERAFKKQKFQEAYTQYKQALEKNPKKTELQFNTAAAAYKTGKFEDSLAGFQKSLQTENIPLQQQAFYNLGNTQYRVGQKTEKSDVKKTISLWQKALKSYEQALQLKADDADAKFNYEFVKKKLEQLQKDQPPEPKEDEKKSEDKEKDKDKKPGDQSKEKKDPSEQKNPPQDKEQQANKPPESKPDQPKEKDQKSDGKEKEAKEPEIKPLPGQMTKEEAKNLLDSLKNDEKKMPVNIAEDGNKYGREEDPKKDW